MHGDVTRNPCSDYCPFKVNMKCMVCTGMSKTQFYEQVLRLFLNTSLMTMRMNCCLLQLLVFIRHFCEKQLHHNNVL